MKRDLFNNKDLAAVILIFAAVIVCYANSLPGAFIYDDVTIVVNNPLIKSFGKLGHVFSSGYWAMLGKSAGLYRPLTILSYQIEYSFAGLNPFFYHMDNVLLHFICSVVVYFLLKNFFIDNKTPLFASLLFAVHTVHTEAVNWIVCRAELLAAFFVFLSLWIFIRKPFGRWSSILSPAVLFLGLMSKESAIIVPPLLTAYLLIFEKDKDWRTRLINVARRIYPFVVAVTSYAALRLFVLGGAVGPGGADRYFFNVGPYDAFLTMCSAFTSYIRLAFLPFGLSAVYRFPAPASIFEFEAIFPIALLVLIAVFSGKIMSRSRTAFFFILWFFIALLPVSNIIPTGLLMSERAMYIPVLTTCVLMGMAVAKVRDPSSGSVKWRRSLAYGLFALVMAAFTAGCIKQNTFWRTEYAFWTHMSGFKPDSAFSHVGMGGALEKMGRGDEAIRQYEAAVRLDGADAGTRVFLGASYRRSGDMKRAVEQHELAIRLDPGNGLAHCELGLDYGEMGMLDDAVREFREAIRLNPMLATANSNLGVAYLMKGQTDEAIEEFNITLRLDPDNKKASENMQYIRELKRKGQGVE